MKLPTTFAVAALGFAVSATPASAQLLNASAAGQYSSAGDYAAGGTGYVTGAFEREYRGFFVFDLPAFSTPIVSAKLDLFNFGGTDDVPPGFYSEDATETLSFFQFGGSIPALLAGGSGLTGTFDDLGSGAHYGSTSVGAGSNGQYVSLFLNAAFLADLNAAAGGRFAFGSALTSLADPNGYEFVFGNTDLASASPAVRLTLTAATTPVGAVPEPSSYTPFAGGVLGLLALRRRLNRRAP